MVEGRQGSRRIRLLDTSSLPGALSELPSRTRAITIPGATWRKPSNAPSPETVQYFDLTIGLLSDPNCVFFPDGADPNNRLGPASEWRC